MEEKGECSPWKKPGLTQLSGLLPIWPMPTSFGVCDLASYFLPLTLSYCIISSFMNTKPLYILHISTVYKDRSYSTMLNHICHSSAILVTITTWRPHVALVFLFVSSFAPCNTPSAHSSVSLYPPATPRGCYDNAFTTQCGWFSQMHMQFLSSP